MDSPPTSARVGAGRSGAVVGFLAIVAAYKLAVMGLGHPLAWVAGFAIDVAIIGTLWVGATSLQRAPVPGARVVSGVLFWPLLVLWFGASFAYTYFFPEGASRHYSLLDVGVDEARFFFAKLLPPTGWLVLGALMAAWVIASVWSARRLGHPSLQHVGGTVALVTLLATTLAWRVPDVPNPAMDIARDLRARATEDGISLGTEATPAGPIALFDRSATAPLTHDSRFKRIVVIVMETMPIDTYRRELAALPPDNFFRRLEEHAHAYSRYYTANQDSRTAMLDMLSSRMIPYEAYDDAGVDIYEGISRMSNLPALLHEKGYATTYTFAQVDSEVAVSDLPWQRQISLSQARIDALKKEGWLCFFPFEFENSCEDKVLTGDLVDFLAHNERAFVYHEMMWGHDLDYERTSKKGNVQYVAEFADSLWKELERRKLAGGTLLVVTGDHGGKAEDRYDFATNYQVPLFFYSPSFTKSVDDRMRTHLDFKELLLHELDPTRPLPESVPFVHVVGPTDTHLRMVVDSAGGLLVYKVRGDKAYVTQASSPRAPDLAAHVAMFEQYRRAFEKAVPKL